MKDCGDCQISQRKLIVCSVRFEFLKKYREFSQIAISLSPLIVPLAKMPDGSEHVGTSSFEFVHFKTHKGAKCVNFRNIKIKPNDTYNIEENSPFFNDSVIELQLIASKE